MLATLRFNRHYLIGKQQIIENKVGNILSCVGRFNNTQRTGAEILKDRSIYPLSMMH